MDNIKNFIDFRMKLKKFNNMESYFNENDKMSEFLLKYDNLYNKFLEIKSLEKGKFTRVKQDEDDIKEQITKKLKKVYFVKMSSALSQNNVDTCEGCIRGLISDFTSYKSKYFDTIVQYFIKDMNRVIDNINVVYTNYNRNKSLEQLYTNDQAYNEIVYFVIQTGKVSASLLQRKYRLSYNKAAHIIDLLEDRGIVGPPNGAKPRDVLITMDSLKEKPYVDYFSQEYCDKSILPNDSTKKDILKVIDEEMNGYDFEKFTKKILQVNSFVNISVTQSSGDFGVDVIAYKDDVKYAIQCKKYSSKVGIKAVQEVIASKSMNNCHVAVVITNNYFTDSAIKLAKNNNVLLWNRDTLKNMIKNL